MIYRKGGTGWRPLGGVGEGVGGKKSWNRESGDYNMSCWHDTITLHVSTEELHNLSYNSLYLCSFCGQHPHFSKSVQYEVIVRLNWGDPSSMILFVLGSLPSWSIRTWRRTSSAYKSAWQILNLQSHVDVCHMSFDWKVQQASKSMSMQCNFENFCWRDTAGLNVFLHCMPHTTGCWKFHKSIFAGIFQLQISWHCLWQAVTWLGLWGCITLAGKDSGTGCPSSSYLNASSRCFSRQRIVHIKSHLIYVLQFYIVLQCLVRLFSVAVAFHCIFSR